MAQGTPNLVMQPCAGATRSFSRAQQRQSGLAHGGRISRTNPTARVRPKSWIEASNIIGIGKLFAGLPCDIGGQLHLPMCLLVVAREQLMHLAAAALLWNVTSAHECCLHACVMQGTMVQ